MSSLKQDMSPIMCSIEDSFEKKSCYKFDFIKDYEIDFMRIKLMECMTYSITLLRNSCPFALPPSILAVDISTASAYCVFCHHRNMRTLMCIMYLVVVMMVGWLCFTSH